MTRERHIARLNKTQRRRPKLKRSVEEAKNRSTIIRMTHRQTLLIAALALLLSVGMAGGSVIYRDGFGAGDLPGMAVLSALFASYLAWLLAVLRARLLARPAVYTLFLLPIAGAAGSAAWFVLIALVMRGWMLAFSFPVGLIWTVAGLTCGVVVARLRHTDGAIVGKSSEVTLDPRHDTVRNRLLFTLLAIGAAYSVRMGMFPSILTLFAIVMIPVFVVAVRGVIRPAVVLSRTGLRRFARIGVILLIVEVIGVPAMIVFSMRRHVTLVATEPVPSVVRVMYDVADGERRALSWERRHAVPTDGLVYTQSARDNGGYRPDNPFPLTVFVQQSNGAHRPVAGTWIHGGYVEVGACRFSFDEFAIGDTTVRHVAALEADSRWLDSLPAWKVYCRHDRLTRVRGVTGPEPKPTGMKCYYNRSGSLTCRS